MSKLKNKPTREQTLFFYTENLDWDLYTDIWWPILHFLSSFSKVFKKPSYPWDGDIVW